MQKMTTRVQQRILNGKHETEGKYENRETAMMTNDAEASSQPMRDGSTAVAVVS